MERYEVSVRKNPLDGGFPIEITMVKSIFGEYVAVEEFRREVDKLYELVDGMDIPSPTIPEYKEWHKNCQEILGHIKEHLMLEED